ncbi:cell division protein FtsX [Alcanivorax sp. HI0083]|uniref:permease-like cell division protein FtsX n=1 Tax=unclassified Alcanivorax TaxID=2638842 RepID=UPI0007B81956|nr:MULTISPECIES: permease-like cell division protein FtsX [unclassified Alcanivorax]KZY38839.1 cell division protein FtsX [Alcanivorax sp. HI0044]KZZ26190.1 cell division protein FtsX [Alcanivorax sp. HI0083]PHR63244.1 MAG: ABC transporter permease [Alcanivorax sp.]
MAPNNTNKGKGNRGTRSATPIKPGRQKAERPRRVAGAHSAQTSLKDRFISWRQHHLDSLRDALQRLNAARASSAMTILVIAIALALPAGLAVLLDNARAITRGWDGNAHLSVFLDMDISEARQRALAEEWQGTENITRTEVITRAQALAEFKALSGFGDVLEALPDNPLPPLIVVFPDSTDPVTLRALENRLGEADDVDLVQLDVEWVRRLHALIELGERLISALTLALAAAVVLVMVNTIRLAIESRREEIVVVKIVGGTDGFVRRPFLYTGFCFGFAGGLTAVILVQVALWWLGGPINELLSLYSSEQSLTSMAASSLVILPLFSGVLGLLGAWLAVGRHLGDIEPNF